MEMGFTDNHGTTKTGPMLTLSGKSATRLQVRLQLKAEMWKCLRC
jgi:hypothetical protein